MRRIVAGRIAGRQPHGHQLLLQEQDLAGVGAGRDRICGVLREQVLQLREAHQDGGRDRQPLLLGEGDAVAVEQQALRSVGIVRVVGVEIVADGQEACALDTRQHDAVDVHLGEAALRGLAAMIIEGDVAAAEQVADRARGRSQRLTVDVLAGAHRIHGDGAAIGIDCHVAGRTHTRVRGSTRIVDVDVGDAVDRDLRIRRRRDRDRGLVEEVDGGIGADGRCGQSVRAVTRRQGQGAGGRLQAGVAANIGLVGADIGDIGRAGGRAGQAPCGAGDTQIQVDRGPGADLDITGVQDNVAQGVVGPADRYRRVVGHVDKGLRIRDSDGTTGIQLGLVMNGDVVDSLDLEG